MKDIKKLIKKIQKSIDKSWDDGYEAGEDVGYRLGYSEGYEEGIAAHKEHVQNRLKASEELSLSVGKGAEAVRMREIAEFLAWEYDPVEAERQAKIADENGF